jgi:hypothetical protein
VLLSVDVGLAAGDVRVVAGGEVTAAVDAASVAWTMAVTAVSAVCLATTRAASTTAKLRNAILPETLIESVATGTNSRAQGVHQAIVVESRRDPGSRGGEGPQREIEHDGPLVLPTTRTKEVKVVGRMQAQPVASRVEPSRVGRESLKKAGRHLVDGADRVGQMT